MDPSSNAYNLIKEFEGLRLTAYQDSVGVWTIGYGHTGPDVYQGLTITQQRADELLVQDVTSSSSAVNSHNPPYDWTQNQFDALVSFTFNLGAGNLNSLTANDTRTIEEISNAIPLYNQAGGVVLPGLVRRRAAEKALFDNGSIVPPSDETFLEGVQRVSDEIAAKAGYLYTRHELVQCIMLIIKSFNIRGFVDDMQSI